MWWSRGLWLESYSIDAVGTEFPKTSYIVLDVLAGMLKAKIIAHFGERPESVGPFLGSGNSWSR